MTKIIDWNVIRGNTNWDVVAILLDYDYTGKRNYVTYSSITGNVTVNGYRVRNLELDEIARIKNSPFVDKSLTGLFVKPSDYKKATDIQFIEYILTKCNNCTEEKKREVRAELQRGFFTSKGVAPTRI